MKFTNRYKKLLIILFLILTVVCTSVIAWVLTRKETNTDDRSNASTPDATVKVFFESTASGTTLNGEAQINILVESAGAAKISAITIPLSFSPEYFEFDRDSTKDAVKQANASCKSQGFKFDNTLAASADASGNLKYSKGSLGTNEELPSGRFCVGTITFKAKKVGNSPVNIKAVSDPTWEIVGPAGSYRPALVVGVTSSAVTIASNTTSTPVPTRASTSATSTPTLTGQVCAQIIRYAYNPSVPSDCRTLANSCVAVPQGFVVVASCPASGVTATTRPTTVVVNSNNSSPTPTALPDTGLFSNNLSLTLLGIVMSFFSVLSFRRIKTKKSFLEKVIDSK